MQWVTVGRVKKWNLSSGIICRMQSYARILLFVFYFINVRLYFFKILECSKVLVLCS